MMEELLLNYLKAACRGREFCASSTELGRAIGVGRTAKEKANLQHQQRLLLCEDSPGYYQNHRNAPENDRRAAGGHSRLESMSR